MNTNVIKHSFKHTLKHNCAIVYALIMRDIKVLTKRIHNVFFDSSIVMLIGVLVWGNLFPLLGMPPSLTGPVFLGNSIAFLVATLGYGYALRLVLDLKSNRFIDYLLTLPLPKKWLFFYLVISYAIEALIITTPLITLGIVFLGKAVDTTNGNFLLFFIFYLLVLMFWGLFFINATYGYTPEWFRNNIWPRRLMPLFNCGPAFFTWSQVNAISPTLSKLMLLNPTTYIAEGLRSSLLGGTDYIAFHYCALALILFCVMLALRLTRSVYTHLDPV